MQFTEYELTAAVTGATKIVRLQQVRLGPSAHFPDMPDGSERHQKENAVT